VESSGRNITIFVIFFLIKTRYCNFSNGTRRHRLI